MKGEMDKMRFDLKNQIVIITGGVGLLGIKHAEAVEEQGAIPILIDIKESSEKYQSYNADITDKSAMLKIKEQLLNEYGHIDVLVNNAANNPKVESKSKNFGELEDFPLEIWYEDIRVGLTGALICTQVFGSQMAKQNKGSIINIGSIYGTHIGPHQSLYDIPKPISYNVVKAGLVGLTKYCATYWAGKNVRCNIVTFAGVYNNQPSSFVNNLEKLIPLGRMANIDEYKEIIVFLASDASSYMTGADIVIDGGITSW
jgi:NAD(P)-dependent dehydrogenase (short-subunit alcohol dehydrogenase family)